ncbi:MAG: TonB-dependent receptor [Pseudomonadales bacterium]
MSIQSTLRISTHLPKGVCKSRVAIAVAFATLACQHNLVMAQSEEAGLEEIVVYGSRSQVINSLNDKKNLDQVADILSATDAGRFADVNAAESLGRLPGVSFLRDNASGDGEFISIRGLDAALNNIQFDGVNAATANRGDRKVGLGGVTTDDISKIEVKKSLLPSDDGVGIGGVVNLISRSPLGYGKDRLTLTAETRKQEFSDDSDGHYFSASANKVVTDNVAFSLSASTQERNIKNYSINGAFAEPLYIPVLKDVNGNVVNPDGWDEEDLQLSNGLIPTDAVIDEQYDVEVDQMSREYTNFSGTLDWAVSENTLLTIGGRYNKREIENIMSEVEFDMDDDSRSGPDYVYDEASGVNLPVWEDPEISWEYNIEDEIRENSSAYFKGTTMASNGNLKLDYQLSYAKAEEDGGIGTEVPFSLDFTIDNSSNVPNENCRLGRDDTTQLLDRQDDIFTPYDTSRVEFPAPVLTENAKAQLRNWQAACYDRVDVTPINSQENTLYSFKFDAEYLFDSGVLRSLKGGVKFVGSETERDILELVSAHQGLLTDGTYLNESDFDSSGTTDDHWSFDDSGLLTGEVMDLDDIGNPYSNIGGVMVPSVNEAKLRNMYSQFLKTFKESGDAPESVIHTGAEEDLLAGYIQGTLTFSENLDVIFGVRAERYDGDFESSQTFEADIGESGQPADVDLDAEGILPLINTSSSNTEVLPRLLVVYRPTDELRIRGSWYTSLARPAYDSLAGGIDASMSIDLNQAYDGTQTADDIDTTRLSMTTGNPDLENAYAHNFDLSFEYYFDTGSAVTFALFYKDIDNFLFEGQTGNFLREDDDFDPVAIVSQLGFSEEGWDVINQLGGLEAIFAQDVDLNISQTRNGNKATVQGFELGFAHQFDQLPGLWSGLGLYGNFTWQDSEADVDLGIYTDDDAMVQLGLAETGDVLTRSVPFFNSPKTSGNLAVYFQTSSLEATLSYFYQGVQMEEVENYGVDQYQQDYEQLDFTLRYKFDNILDKKYGRYEVYLKVKDITDDGDKYTTLETLGKNSNHSEFASFNGREYAVGLRARF